MYKNFTDWLITEKKDIFGMEREIERQRTNAVVKETPTTHLNSDIILTELSKWPLGAKIAKRSWMYNIVEWGDQPGAVKVDFSPWGSWKINILRLMEDLQGNPVWICKGVIPLKKIEENKNEIAIANELYEEVKKIDTTLLEMPMGNYKNLENFIRSLGSKIKITAPSVFLFEGIREVDENNYIIYMGVRAHGVERRGHRRLEQFDINVSYKPETGIIRVIGHDISSPIRQHLWEVKPSEWDLNFSPNQSREDIIKMIATTLSTY